MLVVVVRDDSVQPGRTPALVQLLAVRLHLVPKDGAPGQLRWADERKRAQRGEAEHAVAGVEHAAQGAQEGPGGAQAFQLLRTVYQLMYTALASWQGS